LSFNSENLALTINWFDLQLFDLLTTLNWQLKNRVGLQLKLIWLTINW